MTMPEAKPTERDIEMLKQAIDLAKNCPPGTTFSVGAVITSADGEVLATGYSREGDPHNHAEEAALAKLDTDDPRLPEATMYSSLEPCSTRASRPTTCSQLILNAKIPRVVFAWREPAIFVDCVGAEMLSEAGVEVVEMPELAYLVRETNAYLERDQPGESD